jgi:two-component system, chemotaxis family, sensor kinase CheA
MELSQYLSMFIEESKEHLQAMNTDTMGFEDLASLTHEMENVLDLVRNHKLDMEVDQYQYSV